MTVNESYHEVLLRAGSVRWHALLVSAFCCEGGGGSWELSVLSDCFTSLCMWLTCTATRRPITRCTAPQPSMVPRFSA